MNFTTHDNLNNIIRRYLKKITKLKIRMIKKSKSMLKSLINDKVLKQK